MKKTGVIASIAFIVVMLFAACSSPASSGGSGGGEPRPDNSIQITSLSLKSHNTTLKSGTLQLEVSIYPTTATNKKLEWTSSSPSVATVNASGLVTAKGNGQVTITVKTTDGSNKEAKTTLTVGQSLEYTLSSDNTYYSVTGIGTWDGTDLVIPSEHEGLPVKEIGSKAFQNNDKITSITIPESVQSIKSKAFYRCGSINKITYNAYNCSFPTVGSTSWLDFGTQGNELEIVIGKNVTSIPNYFFNMENKPVVVKKITFEAPLNITSIGARSFTGCTFIQGFLIPENVVSIDGGAFLNSKGFETISFSNKLENLDASAFYNTDVQSITFGEGLKTVANTTFMDCTALKSITYNAINAEVTTPYTNEKNPLLALTKSTQGIVVTIGSSVQKIPNSIFQKNNEPDIGCVTSLIFENRTQDLEIGMSSFRYQEKLETIDLPESVTSLGWYAFENCTGVKNLNILKCKNLTVGFDGLNTKSDVLENVSIGEGVIDAGSVYLGSANVYFNSPSLSGKKGFTTNETGIALTIGNKVQTLGYNFMDSNCTLRKLEFEENSILKEINSHAFNRAYTFHPLESVILPESIEKVEFNEKINLNYLYVGKNVKKIVANVSKAVEGKTPLVEFAATKCDDGSSNITTTEVDTVIKIYKNVSEVNCFSQAVTDKVLFEKGSSCTKCSRFKSVNIFVVPNKRSILTGYFATNMNTVKNLYFEGTTSQELSNAGWDTYSMPSSVKVYYYSETNQAGCWHYDTDNFTPVMW